MIMTMIMIMIFIIVIIVIIMITRIASPPERCPALRAQTAGSPALPAELKRATAKLLGKGQMGSALMGSLQTNMFFDRVFFLVITPVNLLLYSQKCQGEPFSPICQNSLLLQRPH